MRIISLKETTYNFLGDYDPTDCNLPESTENEWLESGLAPGGGAYAQDTVVKVSCTEIDREVFTATTSQTVFAYAHTASEIAVYQQGTLLNLTTDYTEDATQIILNAGATIGDLIEIIKTGYDERVAPVRTYKMTSTVTNVYPPDDDLTNWLKIGATNRWKMFDQYVFTSSEAVSACTDTLVPSTFTIEINTGNTNYLGLFNLDCSSIEIQYKKGTSGDWLEFNPTNFPKVQEIVNYYPYEFERETKVWLDYLFGDFVFKRDLIFPIQWDKVSSMRIKFINNQIGAKASCGMCVCGQSYFIGKTQYGASSGILSFSRKVRDEYTGNLYLKKGNNAKTIDIDVSILNEQYNKIHSVLTAADGVPIIAQANNEGTNYEPFMAYCFVKSLDMTLQYATHSECNLELGGLI